MSSDLKGGLSVGDGIWDPSKVYSMVLDPTATSLGAPSFPFQVTFKSRTDSLGSVRLTEAVRIAYRPQASSLSELLLSEMYNVEPVRVVQGPTYTVTELAPPGWQKLTPPLNLSVQGTVANSAVWGDLAIGPTGPVVQYPLPGSVPMNAFLGQGFLGLSGTTLGTVSTPGQPGKGFFDPFRWPELKRPEQGAIHGFLRSGTSGVDLVADPPFRTAVLTDFNARYTASGFSTPVTVGLATAPQWKESDIHRIVDQRLAAFEAALSAKIESSVRQLTAQPIRESLILGFDERTLRPVMDRLFDEKLPALEERLRLRLWQSFGLEKRQREAKIEALALDVLEAVPVIGKPLKLTYRVWQVGKALRRR